jgi:hypothetical protein
MEKFDNKFHLEYVSGEGVVKESLQRAATSESTFRGMTFEDILAEYRWYVGDPTAELPEEVMDRLIITGKV